MHTTSTSRRTGLTFADGFDPKNNSFGFLRLVLAVLVIFSHSFPLGGFGIDALETFTKGRHTIGLVAVGMFFVLSGFLITRSAAGPVSTVRFLWHRFLRIYPGYWICLAFCGFVFAPYFAYVEHGTLFRVFYAPQGSPQSFVVHNAGLFHLNGFSVLGVLNVYPQSIAGLLSQNPVPFQINGSLWTLPIEVGCYLAIALLAFAGVLRRARIGVLILFGCFWALYIYSYLWPQSFRISFPYRGIDLFIPLCVFFLAGSVCFLYREKIRCSAWLFAACIGAVAASLSLRLYGVVAPICMSYAFLWLAFNLPFSRFDAKGDYSYGTYIYAFPVQQALSLSGVQEDGWAIYFAWSLLLTGMLAFLSYRLVEAPCLRWKNVRIADPRRRPAQPSLPPVVVETVVVPVNS